MFVDLRNKLTHAPLTLQTHGRTICLLYAIWYIIRPITHTDGVHGNVTTVVKSSGGFDSLRLRGGTIYRAKIIPN